MSRKRGLEWNFELEETYDADDVSMIKRLVCVGVCFVDTDGRVWFGDEPESRLTAPGIRRRSRSRIGSMPLSL